MSAGEKAAEDTKPQDGGVRREQALSRRIVILLLVASALMIGQSLYNLRNLQQVDTSIVTVRGSADNLGELARDVATPIADIRMLSMQSVLAPNDALVAEANRALDRRVRDLEARLSDIQGRLGQGSQDDSGHREIAAIRAAWESYREAQAKTRYYIEQGIRVAAFISVTEQEAARYETLKEALATFGRTQVLRSQEVYSAAQDNSRVAFYTLIITGVAQVLILIAILFVSYRTFRTYLRSYEAHQQQLAEANEALQASKDAADDANQAKSAFLANMSHELRTPMNAILGYSEMLIEELEDEELDDFVPDLKKINQAGSHLLSLINDVLDLSKIESGKMVPFPENINVGELIDQVAATAQPLMGKNDNRLVIERGPELGDAYQDFTKLRQTLLNLLSNAAKFTHEGTVTLKAERQAADGGDWLVFSVTDSGIGIAEDKLDHIFEEFSQADSSTTRDYGGTGLGLTISRRFCQMLGGDMTVASELGVGSTFTARLPANLPEARLPAAEAATTAATVEEISAEITDQQGGGTILIIDDDPEASEIIRRALEKDGYHVVTAANGEQGLRLAHDIRPAAITLDVMMPEMDGWSVLRALKADPGLHDIPVIMVSMVEDKSRGYALGAVDYLTKPVDRAALRKTLERYKNTRAVSRAMLVEDDADTRTMMARTLAREGWEVAEAGNGQEAMQMLADVSPQLILLDLMMPVVDGFEFLTRLRSTPDYRHIPVIVVTAKNLTDDDLRRLNGQVEEVLSKNAYTQEQLLLRVSEAVSVHGEDSRA